MATSYGGLRRVSRTPRTAFSRRGMGDALQEAKAGVALGTTAGTALSGAIASGTAVGAGAGTAISISAAIPIVGAIAAGVLGIVTLFKSLFKGPSPYDAIDSGNVESGVAAAYDIWLVVSGEALAGAGDPKSWKTTGTSKSYVNTATFSKRTSAYPDVPNGPLGDQSVDIDQAIAGVQAIVAQVQGQLGEPGSAHYKQSLSNPFFTNGGGGVIPLLQKVKAARAAAGVTDSTTSTIVSEVESNPWAVVAGLGILGFAFWNFI